MNEANTALATRPEPLGLTAITEKVLQDVMRLAEMISAASIKPKGLKTAADVAVVLLKGAELNMTPMQALNEIVVVEGRPTLTSAAIVSLILRSGLAETWVVLESTDDVCTIEAKRRGTMNPVRVTWTAERADKITFASWEGPDNNRRKVEKRLTDKDNWRNYRSQMLRSRCSTELGRLLFPDVITGMYSPDEIDMVTFDGESGEVVSPTPQRSAPPADVAQRLAAATRVVEEPPVTPPASAPEPARAAQPTPPPQPAVAEPKAPTAKDLAKERVADLEERGNAHATASPWWRPFWSVVRREGFDVPGAVQTATKMMIEALDAAGEPCDVLNGPVQKACRLLSGWPAPGMADLLELHVRTVSGDAKWVRNVPADVAKRMYAELIDAAPPTRSALITGWKLEFGGAPTPAAQPTPAPAPAPSAPVNNDTPAQTALRNAIAQLFPEVRTDAEINAAVKRDLTGIDADAVLEQLDDATTTAGRKQILRGFLPSLAAR